jgi:hypothetical protein
MDAASGSLLNNLTVNGELNAYANPVKVNRINFTNTSGSQASDPYCFRWRSETDADTGGGSWLELQMNDDDFEDIDFINANYQTQAVYTYDYLLHKLRARSEKIMFGISNYVFKYMGQDYLEPPKTTMEILY